MPTYFARKAGNINASDVWATTPSGTAAAVTFASGDILLANSFIITVNVSTDLGSTGQVRNDTTGGATVGGGFTLSNGVTLTANAFQGTSGACIQFNGISPNSATLVGNCTNTANGGATASNTSTGTLTITGNVTGGTGGSSHGANNTSTGTLIITGNVTAGSGANFGASNTSTGTLTITGNVTGGTGTNSHGANNASTGTLNVTGSCTAGNAAGSGAFQASTGTLSVIGTLQSSHTAAAVAGANVQQNTILSGPFLTETTRGVAPVYCAAWRWNASPSNSTYMEVMTNNLLAKRNLVTADNITGMPAASNVKSGIAYGPSSELTGTFAQTVSPSSADIATAVWEAASRTLTTSSGPTAVQIRQEMDSNSTKLANLDASISSRLASSAYTAPTTPPTAAQIATAVEGSLLNEADGQAVLNAIVGAIGNTNLSEVSLVAAVRADLERNGGKLDSIPTTAAPSASAVAGAVRTELGVELGRLDTSVSSRLSPSGTLATVTNLTNAPASVTPSDIWSHATRTLTSASGPTAAEIRQEIDANSTKLDAAISTRMAASEATKLDSIKGKTDLLNTDRLSQVATTNIVGVLLAQANS